MKVERAGKGTGRSGRAPRRLERLRGRTALRRIRRAEKQACEDGKIAIRNIRRKAMEQLKKLQKDGDAGEDEVIAAESS